MLLSFLNIVVGPIICFFIWAVACLETHCAATELKCGFGEVVAEKIDNTF